MAPYEDAVGRDELCFCRDRRGAGARVVDSVVEDTTAAAIELHDMLRDDDFFMQTDGVGVGQQC